MTHYLSGYNKTCVVLKYAKKLTHYVSGYNNTCVVLKYAKKIDTFFVHYNWLTFFGEKNLKVFIVSRLFNAKNIFQSYILVNRLLKFVIKF